MRAIFLSALFLLNMDIHAQDYEPDRVNLFITVINSNNQPIPFIEITLIAKDDKQQLKGVTDNKGKFQFIVKLGKTYIVNFKDKPNHSEIIIPANYSGTMVKTIKYDPPANLNINPKTNVPDTIKQFFNSQERPSESEILVMLEIYSDKDLPLENYQVKLFCKKINKVFVSKTNEKGEVFFIVPFNNNYDVGFDDINKIVSINVLADRPGLTYFERLSYTPTIVDETTKNDTIRQVLPEKAGPTSARAFVDIFINDFDTKPLANEKIFLNVVNENLVYATTTDEKGFAHLLVPKGKKYKLNFQYERDVDVLDYTKSDSYSLHTTEIEYQYMGSAKIEEHYKIAKRDKSGFKTEFMETPIKPIAFDERKVKRKSNGFDIDFDSSATTNSPAIYKNKLFMSEGYYSRNFYGFDSKTGRTLWGVELGESGASSAVCDSDVVLVNTESCTLYAIDFNSGKLLWSKWLGPYIYSTPSVADGKVFTVYPNDLYEYSSENKTVNKFVLVSFDLKTGKIIWQNWVDVEVLACPVIADKKVYLTTMSGKLYQFDETSGKMLNSNQANALTPPTIAENKVFVVVKSKTNPANKIMAIYDAKNLGLIKLVPEISDKIIYDYADKSASITMKFNDSRPVYYNGKNYNVVGNRVVCSNPADGSIVWSDMIYTKENNSENAKIAIMPVIAGGKLIVSTPTGEIQLYNPIDGKIIKTFATNAKFCTEPVIKDGWIYIGNENGKLISINTLDKTLSGWSMWGFSASHNTIVK